MNRDQLASIIDHTLLRQDASSAEIEELCREVLEYGFATACVNPIWVAAASSLLRGSGSAVCSVVGFPLGASECMPQEAARAVEDGAGEIDMVIPVGFLKSGMVEKAAGFIGSVVGAVPGIPVKVIIETCLLTDDEKIVACRLAMDGGAKWVKTSTGFSTGGATAHDVALMREVVGDRLGVKASGGIRTIDDAMTMIEAGAGRLGCSRSVRIVNSID
jgi:deoxyribose-phosphate aldolase